MILRLLFIALISFCLTHPSAHGQSMTGFSQGHWFKVAVEQNGVYEITREMMANMGFSVNTIDPKKIAIYGMPGGMLPQENSALNLTELTQIAIEVTGQNDGKLDGADVIRFYGEGSDKIFYRADKNIFSYENNLYSDLNFYFITVGEEDGKRLTDATHIQGAFPAVSQFNNYVHHELDAHNELNSGREWYGEKFSVDVEHTFTLPTGSIVPGSTIRLVSDVMGQSYQAASFKILLNGTLAGTQNIFPIPSGRYSIKGYDRRDTLNLSESAFGAAQRSEQVLTYQFQKAEGYSQGYLDFVLLNFEQDLALTGKQTIFTSGRSLNQPISTFELKNADAGISIWDITDFYNVARQNVEVKSDKVVFSTPTNTLKRFVAFREALTPTPIAKVNHPDLFSLSPANLLIITHSAFETEADRLATHRSTFSNWSVHVVTTEQIYDHFSSGRQDVSAIRDFIKHLYDKNPTTVKAVLMFGRGSFDYKDRISNNTNFVPTYESRNSLHPLETYSSDDFFGFMESTEGGWGESPFRNHTLDIGLGRLPVTSVAQAKVVVDKIIAYDLATRTHQPWRKKIVFVADDGNAEEYEPFTSLHQSQANILATNIENSPLGFDARRLFMGTYRKVLKPNGETVPDLAADIDRAFEDGALIINYTGHGSEKLWADERVFNEEMIEDLQNEHYPFLVTATCEFGRNDDPTQTSSAEKCITKVGGGAIGLVTTARPVSATTNFGLNDAFYDALLDRDNNQYPHLGEVFRNTKNNSISGVSNRNFILLADPSMTLALPPNDIVVTSVQTADGSDTLRALSRVTIEGTINNVNGIISGFNGVVEAAMFDKPTDFVTIGRNNPAFNFQQWHNILFRGKATVNDGQFSLTFVMPKNIAYNIAEAKVSLYASSDDYGHATGFSTDFKVGGTEPNPPTDNLAPALSLYMGDSTFRDGGVTEPDTYLLVAAEDTNGINISGHGVGNSLIAILDGTETFVLNDYYVAVADDFQKGTVKFPLKNLEPGPHSIVVKAWDVYNNPSQAMIRFTVSKEGRFLVQEFGNYPNPVATTTKIFFRHNASGEDLEAELMLYSPAGELIEHRSFQIPDADHEVELIEWDISEKKLSPGLYLARLVARSVVTGSKNERLAKLIILN